VLLATGRLPNTEGLNLEAIGLETDEPFEQLLSDQPERASVRFEETVG
jgi:pyruvate/2-oxoglutarate dehydrogenase complex dihydrolipoamide dehydrogenase (E3) component